MLGTAVACLSACSGAAPRGERSADARTGTSVEELVRFGAWLQTLDNAELDDRYEQLLMEYRASPSNDMAIKLSLVLSRPGAEAGELAEALAVLTQTRDERGEDGEIGRLLYSMINERHLAAAHADSLAASLADERERSARLDAELATARASIETAQRERAALIEQLDALKAIEARIARDSEPRVE